MTPRQKQLYEFIRDWRPPYRPPTQREMADALGCKQQQIFVMLRKMEAAGTVHRPRHRRWWEVVPQQEETT